MTEHTESRDTRDEVDADAPSVTSSGRLDVSPTASEEEAAAIVAAVGAHLRELEAASAQAEAQPSWHGERWTFAGRLQAIGESPARVPLSVPRDGWVAASRSNRFF